MSFLEKNSSEEIKVIEAYKNVAEIKLYSRPSMLEMEDCFSGGYEEVLWISHSILSGKNESLYLPIYINKKGNKIRLFNRWFKKLANQTYFNMKKFRVAFCGLGSSIYSTSMDELLNKFNHLGVEIDLMGRSKIGSFLSGSDVVNLTKKWLSKSIQNRYQFKKWKTERNPFCKEDFWAGCDRSEAEYVLQY